MPENQGEKQREIERKAEAAAKARKELADMVRLAAELRVLNQISLTSMARKWAEKLFDTTSMSGPEFEGWRAEGLDLFGPPGGEAADIAREVGAKPKDGYVTVRGDGKIIARHRDDEFLFTSQLALPWVDSASNVEFSGLADRIETEEGDGGFGTGDDPEPVDDDPSGFLAGMSRDAQNGGNIDPTFIPDEVEAKNRIVTRSNHVNLSESTRRELGQRAELIGSVMETTKRQIRRGADIKVPKVARPDPATFGDDHSAPTVPTKPPKPVVSTMGATTTDPTLSGPEPDPVGDHGKGRPWFDRGAVHDAKSKDGRESLDDLEARYRGYADLARNQGLVLAPGLLEHYLDGSGQTVTWTKDHFRSVPALAELEERIKDNVGRTLLGEPLTRKRSPWLAALRDLTSTTPIAGLYDDWVAQVDWLPAVGRILSLDFDFYLGIGRTKLSAVTFLDARLDEKTQAIVFEGKVKFSWREQYDFHIGQPGGGDMTRLAAAGRAAAFTLTADWTERFTGSVIPLGNDKYEKLVISWTPM